MREKIVKGRKEGREKNRNREDKSGEWREEEERKGA